MLTSSSDIEVVLSDMRNISFIKNIIIFSKILRVKKIEKSIFLFFYKTSE